MTLLIVTFAAIISTIVWYVNDQARDLKISVLCYCFWGASLMWLVDAIFEYAQLRAAYFTPAYEDMVNDAFLGLSAVALGMVIWLVVLMIKDPKHILKSM